MALPLDGGVESLNVAMAATVLLYEARRQRQVAPGDSDWRGPPRNGEAGAPMNDDLARIQADATARIAAATTVEELRTVSQEVLGKKSELVGLRKQLGGLDEATRKSAGEALNATSRAIQAAVEDREGGLAQAERAARYEAERLDLTEVIEPPTVGHLHVVTQTWQELEDIFVGMGFTVAEGPEVETDWYNFVALNIPDSHPARRCGTRSASTSATPRQRCCCARRPARADPRDGDAEAAHLRRSCPGRVYRRGHDGRHAPAHVPPDRGPGRRQGRHHGRPGRAPSCSSSTAYFGPDIESRLRPSLLPVHRAVGRGRRLPFEDRQTWIELGGCGMVHPNVLRGTSASTPRSGRGWAFGFGIDRMAMMRHGIDDIRQFVDRNDVRFLRAVLT